MSESQHVLGHSDDELNRLTVQGRLIEPITRHFLAEAGISTGMRDRGPVWVALGPSLLFATAVNR